MHQIDKGAFMQKTGYRKSIWDYSIDFNGIAELTRKICRCGAPVQPPVLRENRNRHRLETIQFPYVPAMQRLADKWRNVPALA